MSEPAPRRIREWEAEDEIDLGRYWDAVVTRWWLPVVGLVVGVAVGLALAAGGEQVWRSRSVVYLGQPLSPSGAQVQSLATNPSTVREIIRSDFTLNRVARETGLPRSNLSGKVTSQPVKGNLTKLGQTPLVAIIVTGKARAKVGRAANLLAAVVVAEVSDYADAKAKALQEQVAQDTQEVARIDARTQQIERSARSLAPADRIAALSTLGFMEQRRGIVSQDLREAQQLLVLAQNVERARIVEPGVTRKATARSRRNSLIVGGALGLLLGTIAALVWDPLARRRAAA
jgi:uncharacterized protein involved in exopolysaccharide biosynthesis